MSESWPSTPPEPTDFAERERREEVKVTECPYCRELIDRDDQFAHQQDCSERDRIKMEYRVPNGWFALVVPEQTGYLWLDKTGGFLCRQVSVEGTLIPLRRPSELNLDLNPLDVPVDKFDSFDDPEEARYLYIKGVRESNDHEYGGIDLGAKLLDERLRGIYSDDEVDREEAERERPDRINAVWERIDEQLPFEYEQVAAPVGKPLTTEGLRWLNVTGHNTETILYPQEWVDALVEMEQPVALYYPNCD